MFIAPKHVCNELIKINSVTFKICAWKFKKQGNQIPGLTKGEILQSPFSRDMKSAADSIHSPKNFESLNCETKENDENDNSYHENSW